MADGKDLTQAFNDPANRKFRKLWTREADIADEFELGCNWYQKWTQDRDAYAAKGDAPREKFCADLVAFWDRYLVKAASHLAKHEHNLGSGKDKLSTAFAQAQLTTLQPLHDALAPLGEKQLESGKAIFEALKPLMVQEAQPAVRPPQPPKP